MTNRTPSQTVGPYLHIGLRSAEYGVPDIFSTTLADSQMPGQHIRIEGRILDGEGTPMLDAMVEIASRHPAAVGARMTGAGFGGSAVALVRASGVDDFVRDVSSAYGSATGNPGTLYACRAVGGAFLG